MSPFNFDRRACEECRAGYVPRSRTQRYCPGCEVAERSCEACGTSFTVRRTDLRKRPAQFCSIACRRRQDGLHFNPAQGRWYVICRDQSKFLFSRAVMAGAIGRLPVEGEVVHHRNENKADDRIENLRLMTVSEHCRLHHPKGVQIGTAR